MELALSFIAIILSWLWIEIFLLLFVKIKKNNDNLLSFKKFRWLLRAVIIILFLLILIYMYVFETEELKKTISLCIGIIK